MGKGQKLNFRVFLFFLIVSLSFYGCATMKKEECLTVNWYNIGYEDGVKGYKTSRIAKHRKSCSKYGVIPNLQLYQRGHAEGLREYCTPHQGYILGLKGRTYNDICQGELKNPFQEGYNIGLDIYIFQKDISKKQKALNEIKEEIVHIEELLKEKEASLSKDCINSEKCKLSLDNIRSLDKKKSELYLILKSQKNLIEAMRQTLSDMKNQNRF
jgi:hypothetical protein